MRIVFGVIIVLSLAVLLVALVNSVEPCNGEEVYTGVLPLWSGKAMIMVPQFKCVEELK